MPFLIALLSLFYFFFGLGLVAPSFQDIMIISLLGGGYVLLFIFVWRKPEYSVYAFLIVELFIPRGGERFLIFRIQELPAVSIHYLLQSIAATTICLNAILHRPRSDVRRLRLFFYLIIASIFLLVIFTGFFFYQENPYGVIFTTADFISYGPLLFGLAFLLGCINFINDLKKLEIIYGIFLVMGVVMVIESIAYVYLQLPLPFVDRVINWSGRFGSFFSADFVRVGQLAGVAIGSAMYFIFSRRRYFLLPLVSALFIPIIATYQRTPMAMGALIIGIFLLLTLSRHPTKILAPLAMMLVPVSILLLASDFNVINRISSVMKGDVRPDYFVSYMDSWESRAGAYLRAVDVLLVEPLGVGFTRSESFMGSMLIPNNFALSQEWSSAISFYNQISSGRHDTTAHNFYLDFGMDYGLLALAALLWLFYCSLAQFRRFYQMVKQGNIKNDNLFLLYCANFSILFGIAFNGIYYNSRLYSVLFFVVFVTFLPGKLQSLEGLPAGRRE